MYKYMEKQKIVELLIGLLSEEKTNECVKSPSKNGQWRIVVLQRGWVYIGKYFQQGDECWLEDASCIRSWGTTKGLGELAKNGPLQNTKLDPCPTVRFHRLGVVNTIDCDNVWDK